MEDTKDLETFWMDIGPEEAMSLLEGNDDNRSIAQHIVDLYAKDMAEGRWKQTGNTFSIYRDGEKIRLLNGQHRLWAIVQSGVTVRFLVVVEEDPEVYSTFDVGYVRTTAQILKMAGFVNTNVVGALARFIINYDRYIDSTEPWLKSTINTAQVKEWVMKQDAALLSTVLSDFHVARSHIGATNTWYAALSYLVRTRSAHPERWLEFHTPFSSGVDLHHRSPILVLRQYTHNRSRLGTRYAQNRWDRQAHLAVAIRAWNHFLSNKEAQVYRFSKSMLPMPKVD